MDFFGQEAWNADKMKLILKSTDEHLSKGTSSLKQNGYNSQNQFGHIFMHLLYGGDSFTFHCLNL